MDEYRPYPPEPPADDAEDTEHEPEPQPETVAQRPTPSASYDSSDHDDDDDDDHEGDEDDLGDEEEDEDEGEEGAASGRAERPERAAPNLDHPGGHLTGTVARLNRPRRFGFLRTEDSMEIFFHASALESGPNSFDSLRTGQTVEFDCHQDEQGRGLAATLVQVVGPPPEPQPRPQRQAREPREPREPREDRRGGRGERAGWRVVVLRERQETTLSAQLERLLNERSVKPGSFNLTVVEGDQGAELWVAIHTEESGGGGRHR
jgi:cold shock CspA family protein